MLDRKDKLIQEMSQLMTEFYSNMSTQYTQLTTRHKKERRLVLSAQWKEKKLCFSDDRRQPTSFPGKKRDPGNEVGRQQAKLKEQKDNCAGKPKKLFLDNTASL